jgi:hypothetical protein
MRCSEQLVNISNWTLDEKIKDRINGSGFEHLNNISTCRHHARLLESIASRFDAEKCIFQFDNFHLLFGLKDVLYITGLHITGKPVTGIDDDPITWSQKCFGENLCMRKNNKLLGSIRLDVLKAKFMNVPDDASDEVLDRHARAYVCYMLGSSLFSTSAHDYVPTMYLPLVFEVQKIKDYAWGAAALAHLYCSLKSFKENGKHLNGIAFSLQVSSLLYIHLSI